MDQHQRHLKSYLLAASVVVFLLVVTGGMARATETGGACVDWPTCFGRWTPPQGSAVLDYTHRAITALSLPFVLAAAWAARRYPASDRWSRRLIDGAVGILALQVALGAWMVLGQESPTWISSLHLGLSLIMLGLLVAATVGEYVNGRRTTDDLLRQRRSHSAFGRRPTGQALRGGRRTDDEYRVSFASPFARLSLVTLAALALLLISGAVVASTGAAQACPDWPLCDGLSLPDSMAGWLNFGHRGIVLITGVLVLALLRRAWISQRSQTPVLVASTAVGVLFFAQALMGARLVEGFPPHLLVLHQASAAAAWAVMVAQVTLTGLAGRSGEDERREALAAGGRQGLLRDFLMLTKPIVVALLLVTTYAGMVIGAKSWPSLELAFWTLLGGFMAAGGSGAINQYIDRYDDLKMQRTQKRPIPAGRLTPGEGLAFGVGMALASFYLVAALVNFLAALLTLAGIIYYVLLYSLLLKKTTVQNIVIGGGAGAIPPLVGWAAATGALNIPSLFLFAVVFMWTPPHFWALALVRRLDYARAGVPMLPVVRGEAETRWQIFLYTLELVGLTLLLPLFGLGGSVYLVGAAALGGWLLLAAWKVWKQGGNRVAWKMYRYSSMYLAFLFMVLMMDALI